MGKYGLSGNSGFVSEDKHVAASYDSNGMVFVEVDDGHGGTWWRRIARKEAEDRGLSIILCSMCDKPAVSLDHHWPYDDDLNRCEKHHGKRDSNHK